jgi:hypothetical protein
MYDDLRHTPLKLNARFTSECEDVACRWSPANLIKFADETGTN